ncbi:MAG TPA: hypothetical protein VFZ34_31530 [Blastocatellia bacterium]|nr:hypothetical protein [Blastocatellia bacterium]
MKNKPRYPISQFLWFEASAAHLRTVADLIDDVHLVTIIPQTIVRSVAGLVARGQYKPSQTNATDLIEVHSAINDAEMSLLHELGHLLDYRAIGKSSSYASQTEKALSRLQRAMNQSQAVKTLEQHLSVFLTRPDATGQQFRQSTQKYLSYLLLKRELFARAYTQYIVMKSQSPQLLRQLDAIRYNPKDPFRFRQWEASDFQPIFAEFDQLFRRWGWSQ